MKISYLYAGAAVAGLVGLWWFTRPGRASQAGAAVVGAVADVGAGAVIGVGEVVGIPRTNQSQCEKDLAAGRMWDASFSCPAGRFLGGVWNSTLASGANQVDARLTDSVLYSDAMYGGDPRTGSW